MVWIWEKLLEMILGQFPHCWGPSVLNGDLLKKVFPGRPPLITWGGLCQWLELQINMRKLNWVGGSLRDLEKNALQIERRESLGVGVTQETLPEHDFPLSILRHCWLENFCYIPTTRTYNLITVLFLFIFLLLSPCKVVAHSCQGYSMRNSWSTEGKH